jgi:hypothetical protein
MDTTVTRIAAVVVAELRTAGYLGSTIGQYEKTIKALTSFVEDRGGREAVNAATPAINSPPTQRLTEDQIQALYSLR